MHAVSPGTTIEALVPDFKGCRDDLRTVVEASAEVLSHNIETVRRLTPQVRVQARYERSLEVLRTMKELGAPRTKSGLMLGLGETEQEVLQTLSDLREAGVDIVTIGQYLQPTRKHLPVQQYVHPDLFAPLPPGCARDGFPLCAERTFGALVVPCGRTGIPARSCRMISVRP